MNSTVSTLNLSDDCENPPVYEEKKREETQKNTSSLQNLQNQLGH